MQEKCVVQTSSFGAKGKEQELKTQSYEVGSIAGFRTELRRLNDGKTVVRRVVAPFGLFALSSQDVTPVYKGQETVVGSWYDQVRGTQTVVRAKAA